MIASHLIDGSQLKAMYLAGSYRLQAHVPHINALNVFPVPDGDTGTNMSLTLQAALKDVRRYSGSHAGDLATMASQGALMGARGNSGVILSQILEGFSEAIQDKAVFSTLEFADGLQRASNKAYKAVLNPVEGTILTVIKEAARIAGPIASKTSQIQEFLAQIVETATTTLHLTPELLPTLKEAGVVDSGGQGLVYFLEGMFRYVKGVPVNTDDEAMAPPEFPMPSKTVAFTFHFGYDVQFLIRGDNLNVEAIRQAITAMGACPLVVGNAQTLKVHVHVADPGLPLSYGVKQGTLLDIVVENMDEQSHLFNRPQKTETDIAETQIALICVAPGPGLSEVFKSLGASVVVAGGQTMNPSTQELLQVVETVQANRVIILPNNANIVLAAQQVSGFTAKTSRVVPAKTIPQGISALLAFNAEADLETNVTRMQSATGSVQTIELTQAARDTMINGLQISQGDVIGLLDGALIAGGPDVQSVCLETLAKAQAGQSELVTLYYGETVTQTMAQSLAGAITNAYPHLETDIINGGQPHYPYIVSLE